MTGLRGRSVVCLVVARNESPNRVVSVLNCNRTPDAMPATTSTGAGQLRAGPVRETPGRNTFVADIEIHRAVRVYDTPKQFAQFQSLGHGRLRLMVCVMWSFGAMVAPEYTRRENSLAGQMRGTARDRANSRRNVRIGNDRVRYQAIPAELGVMTMALKCPRQPIILPLYLPPVIFYAVQGSTIFSPAASNGAVSRVATIMALAAAVAAM